MRIAWLFLIGLLLAYGGVYRPASAGTLSPDVLNTSVLRFDDCRLWKPADFELFFESLLAPSKGRPPDKKQLSPEVETLKEFNQQPQRVFERCGARLQELGLGPCSEHRRTIWAMEARKNGGYEGNSIEISQEEYERTLPRPLMDLPPELNDGLPDNWQQLFTEKGWPYLQYRSGGVVNEQHLPEKKGFHGRLLVWIPGPHGDQWINFTMPDTPGQIARQIDFIGMQKPNSPEGQFKMYFRQFTRDSGGKNPAPNGHLTDFCYKCHISGMRGVVPESGTLQPVMPVSGETFSAKTPELQAEERLGRIMKAFSAYGIPEFSGMVHPEKLGPPEGKNVGCLNCHDGKIKGQMTHSSHEAMVRDKVLLEKTMPPGLGKGPENDAKRRKIVEQLRIEGEKDYQAWLHSPQCPKEPDPSAVFDTSPLKSYLDSVAPSPHPDINTPSAGAGH